jgi:hypothetical protein
MEVFVGSDAIPPESRRVIAVTFDITTNTIAVRVDGSPDMNRLLVSQRAYIFHYRYGTVNGSKFIMIPRAGDVGLPLRKNEPALIRSLPPDLRAMDTDLQLDADDDIILTAQGDVAVATGLVAASQALHLKAGVQAEELAQNPLFGFPSLAGALTSAQNPASLMAVLLSKMIANDSRFAGTRDVIVSVEGNVVRVQASVLLSNSNVVVPLTFTLPNEG